MNKGKETKENPDWFTFCTNKFEEILSPSSLAWMDSLNVIRELRDSGGLHGLPDWEDAVSRSIVTDRSAYLSLLRDVSIGLLVYDLEDSCNKDEMALIHLVRILDEIDRALSRLYEKIEDYYIAMHPSELAGYEKNIRELVDSFAKKETHPLRHLAKNLINLQESRSNIALHVREYAEKVIPNMSALCGPLVAARLLEHAGSIDRLARMPGSSLQVLGAGPSLFKHLTIGSNPPKHGIIYQYKGIHHAKRKSRGKVSRVVACQLGIAARIDRYRGSRDEVFIEKAGDRICRAGKRL